jgi:hypothetical protein
MGMRRRDDRDCHKGAGAGFSTARRASLTIAACFHRDQTALEPSLVLAQQLERGRYATMSIADMA